MRCICGSQSSYAVCCEPYLNGIKNCPTAEALMRSRYTAYALNKLDYIEKSMLPPALDHFDRENSIPINWVKLEFVSAKQQKSAGKVEYIASYEVDGQIKTLHEIAQFLLVDGRWYYVDGKIQEPHSAKLGRNSPCCCGSGRKFKKCCQYKVNCGCNPNISGHIH